MWCDVCVINAFRQPENHYGHCKPSKRRRGNLLTTKNKFNLFRLPEKK
ncbi:MAG: hypothetical protein IJ143_00095 [Neisseriaceae bacterium]|nr:hypothetical protein [Neisseriaceae bacterium]